MTDAAFQFMLSLIPGMDAQNIQRMIQSVQMPESTFTVARRQDILDACFCELARRSEGMAPVDGKRKGRK